MDAAFPRGVEAGSHAGRRTPIWPAKFLLLTLALPFFFPVGPLFLTADRIFLLLAFVPCVILWLTGRAGRIGIADIAVVLTWFWMTVSMVVIDGAGSAVEAAGINLLETVGAYLVARCFVRDADAFHDVVRFLFIMTAAMFPFALYEALTSRNILLEIANSVWPSYADVPKEKRWGLDRVASVFYHPILFGVFCGSCFSLAYYVLGYGSSAIKRLLRTFVVGATCFLSLSSGPLTALVAQAGLITFDSALAGFKNRWTALSGGVLALWVSLEIAANRSVPELFLTYFAFNPATAYNRIRIWRLGTDSVANHPLFGIGLSGDWVRPWWMSGSMDMFWLVPAVKHGLPAGLLLHFSFLAVFLSVALRRGIRDRAGSFRTGLLICLMGFYLAGWTVHYWKVIYVLFMFLLGCGSWILAANGKGDEPGPEVTGSEVDGRDSFGRRPSVTWARVTPPASFHSGRSRENSGHAAASGTTVPDSNPYSRQEGS
jgi:hypothetical protein